MLMTLRESEPEDREINLQLARLAAARQDVTEAAALLSQRAVCAVADREVERTAARARRARPVPPHA